MAKMKLDTFEMAEERTDDTERNEVTDGPECPPPTVEDIEAMNRRVALLETWAGHISYDVGRLQGDAARRRLLTRDFARVALGIYVGLIIAYIIVS
jgi:hypothetical protein